MSWLRCITLQMMADRFSDYRVHYNIYVNYIADPNGLIKCIAWVYLCFLNFAKFKLHKCFTRLIGLFWPKVCTIYKSKIKSNHIITILFSVTLRRIYGSC